MKKYDGLVIGGGHAGIEATFALANRGFKVGLVTIEKNRIGQMPCNPAIGGPAKGILTREIDALGGMQGLLSDRAMIQIKMLNTSKGPSVRALRAQIDKEKYIVEALKEIDANENIDVIEGLVDDVSFDSNKITGIKLEDGRIFESGVVIISTGTYMDSSILVGDKKTTSGPDGQPTSSKISKSLTKMGFQLQRLKTGTPPRVETSSIDFTEVDEEILDVNTYNFSNRSNLTLDKQIHCYITYTNDETHKIVDENINKSSMYSGLVKGVGPRYCPSIEDKIVRFRNKERHQIFYEPETAKGDSIYVNGLSTSMPIDVQEKMLKTLPGMKNANVLKWAYAIEYDAIDSRDIKPNLESKEYRGLFFAGQVNGTSGYEEAAAQGLIAGINAGQLLKGLDPLKLRRDESYIGVLIDDLVTKGTKEPYRMLTSRAEYRLLLRTDNADQRLSKYGNDVDLISDKHYNEIKKKYSSIQDEFERLKNTFVSSKSDLAKKYNVINGPSFLQILARPNVDIHDVSDFEFIYEVSILARLGGYIRKQENEAKKLIKMETVKIPQDINYNNVLNLATEAKQKLIKITPETIGQASRISGINPSDIQMLLFYIDLTRKKKNEN